jgi:hypothetical protein
VTVEKDVDAIEFICPRCSYRWTRSYELVHCELPSGEVRDYFSLGGQRVLSPYHPAGAPKCPECSWIAVGHLTSRMPAHPATAGEPPPATPSATRLPARPDATRRRGK